MDKASDQKGVCLNEVMELNSFILLNGRTASDPNRHFSYVGTNGCSVVGSCVYLWYGNFTSTIYDIADKFGIMERTYRKYPLYYLRKPWFNTDCLLSKSRVKKALKECRSECYSPITLHNLEISKKEFKNLSKYKKCNYLNDISNKLLVAND